MKAFVFTDKALTSHAGRFVWLALDSENAKNARTLKKYPVNALPSFLVVAPDSERVVMRWVGGMNVKQLVAFLDKASAAAGGSEGDLLARADRFYGAGNYADAGPAYQQAIAAAPARWADYPRAVEAALFSLSDQEKFEETATLAEKALPDLIGTPSELTAAAYGLDASVQLPAENPRRSAWMKDFERRVSRLIEDPKLAVAVDDRSGAYISLVDARKE